MVKRVLWWPVSPELALATISVVEVLGAFPASPAVKAALASRTV